MDWRAPERVFGSGLDTVALRVLWRAGTSMTGEQVARVAPVGSPRGIRYALGRLVDFGIISASNVGQAIAYEVNREHLTYPAVDAAFRALDPWALLTERLSTLVEAHDAGGGISVAIFGSVARGDASTESDVDVLLVVPETGEPGLDLQDLISRNVRAWTGRPAGVYLTTPQRLAAARTEGDPIVDSFARDAVTLVGPDVMTYVKGPR